MSRRLIRGKTLFIGHRGARGLVDENTLESLRKGIALGIEMVEFDVHLTRDKKFVLMHDETIDRTTAKKGRVSKFSLAEIKKIRTKNGYAIPDLEEALALAKKKGVRIFLDTKQNRNHEEKLIRVLKKLKIIESTIVDTERPASSLKLKALCPELKVAVSPPNVVNFLLRPVKYLNKFKADYVDINHTFVTKKLVEKLHKNGLGITTWVLNNKRDIKRFVNMGVDGIMSDYPGLFKS
jgi:glycerophosphoryl diester phosphodiesterase